MAKKKDDDEFQINCPVCTVELAFSGEEQVGEEIFCPYCNAPFILVKREDETFDVEEDF